MKMQRHCSVSFPSLESRLYSLQALLGESLLLRESIKSCQMAMPANEYRLHSSYIWSAERLIEILFNNIVNHFVKKARPVASRLSKTPQI